MDARHKRGYTKEGEGYQPPDPKLADAYRDAATFPPFEFDADTQRFLIEVAHDVCGRRGWSHHGASSELTHLHVLVSWRCPVHWEDVRGKLKNILSLELSKRSGTTGRPWFSTKASRKRVRDRGHFDYLLRTYLHGHSGWRWDQTRGWTEPRRKGQQRTENPHPSTNTTNSPTRKGGVATAQEAPPPTTISFDIPDDIIEGLSVE